MTTLELGNPSEHPRKSVKSKEFDPISYLENTLDKMTGTVISAKKIAGGKVNGHYRVNWYSPSEMKVVKSQFIYLELINGEPVIKVGKQ